MAGILLPHAGRDPQCGRHLGRHPRGRCRPQCARCRPRCRPQCARQRPTRQFPYGRSIPPWSAFRAFHFLSVFTVFCGFWNFLGVLWAAGRPKVLQKGEDGAYLPATWVSKGPNWPRDSSKNGCRSRKTGQHRPKLGECGQQDGQRCCKRAKMAPTCPQHGSARGPTGPRIAPRMAAATAKQASIGRNQANMVRSWTNTVPKDV